MLKTHDFSKYLSYGLQVQHNGKNYPLYGIYNTGVFRLDNKAHNLISDMYEAKPYLRPISQLAKEITHNGQTFIPIVELAKLAEIDEADLYEYQWFTNGRKVLVDVGETGRKSFGYLYGSFVETNGSVITPIDDQQLFFEKCYEWHFWLGDQSYFDKRLILPIQ